MIQIRYNIFETNSSSTMTFMVSICQIEGLDIPPVIKLDSNGDWWENGVNNVYAWAKKEEDEEAFFGLLSYVGVKEIYVDGKQVQVDSNNRHIKFTTEEIALAKSFGDFRTCSEWIGHGGEWDNTHYLTKEEVKNVQTFMKDPNYVVICRDEDGNEIDWFSTRYSKMVITDEDIENERKYLANKKKYEEDYDDFYADLLGDIDDELEEQLKEDFGEDYIYKLKTRDKRRKK